MIATPASSWIAGVEYRPFADGTGALAIYLRHDGAMLYTGVPSWVPGLLVAGIVSVPRGSSLVETLLCQPRRSPGRAYNRIVKGRFLHRRVIGPAVANLRQAMAA